MDRGRVLQPVDPAKRRRPDASPDAEARKKCRLPPPPPAALARKRQRDGEEETEATWTGLAKAVAHSVVAAARSVVTRSPPAPRSPPPAYRHRLDSCMSGPAR